MKLKILLVLLGSLVLLSASTASQASPAKWGWPLDPHTVTRNFERPAQNWLPGHRGIDLAGNAGDEVKSAGSGEVIFAGIIAGKGVVVVRHGSVRTTYEPVHANVEVGKSISTGDVIGTLQVGESHCASSFAVSCLHWGLIRGQVYLNPLSLVKKQVRLLPLYPSR